MEAPNKDERSANSKWPEVMSLIRGLWPGQANKYMNTMVEQNWKERLGNIPFDRVKLALKMWAADNPYFPKAGQIYKDCTKEKQTNERIASRKDVTEELAEYNNHWSLVYATVSKISEEDKEEHKRTVMLQDWRLRWLKDQPTSSRVWIAIIHQRIKKKIPPDRFDPSTEIPEHKPTKHRGNLTFDQPKEPEL